MSARILFTVRNWCRSALCVAVTIGISATLVAGVDPTSANTRTAHAFDVQLRSRNPQPDGWIQIATRSETWSPRETAIIVCDMWDAHHCLNAVRRVKQLAPRIDQLLHKARAAGSTIIHAPSSCMKFYEDHPARQRVARVPRAAVLPDQIESWCHWKHDQEQATGYPIDHSDGGEDDDPAEHEAWHAQLAALGRNPGSPWIRQIDSIHIDDADYITDDGVENWSVLEHHGIKNVLLVGVHTNMCVLGRPFGLRQLSRNGQNVALVRDLTDTMYNPAMPPFVNHFSGTDLIVEHIEQHVCPTITSDQILGGQPLQFRNDNRPHIVMLIGEREYMTRVTLPNFARKHLYRDYRVSYVFADPDDLNQFPQVDQVSTADLLVVSVRRRTPPAEQLAVIRQHVESGKPVVGIRTASHAFALRDGQQPPTGHAAWPEFDAQVFGGNYQGHHGNKAEDDERSFVWVARGAAESQILSGIRLPTEHPTTSWMYKTSPLRPGTQIVMMGRVGARQPHEPIAWTNIHLGGGRAFYTSLGHPDDFADAVFQQTLRDAIDWSLNRPSGSRQRDTRDTASTALRR